MSARIISMRDYAPKQGEYLLLLSALPDRKMETIGVLLLDPARDLLYIRLRRDWAGLISEEDAGVFIALEEDLQSLVLQKGAAGALAKLESELSNSLRITDREAVTVHDFDK